MNLSKNTEKISEMGYAKVPNAPPALSSDTNSANNSRQDFMKNENTQSKTNHNRADTTLSIMTVTGHQKSFGRESISGQRNNKIRDIHDRNRSLADSKMKERLKRRKFNKTLIKTNQSSNMMTHQYLSGPSIPCKTQKILKKSPHAEKVNKFLQSNMKLKTHKRGLSFQNELENSFNKQDLIDLSKKPRPSSLLREKRKGFSTSSHRFDKKIEFERFYDTTPGPGSYNLIQDLTDKANELMLDSEMSPDLQCDSKFRGKLSSIMNNSAILHSNRKFGSNNKGTFGFSERVLFRNQHSPGPGPGPGQYNSVEFENKLRKRIISHKIKEKKPALKLPFPLSNPLNYVNSYTVNVYYKPGFPGVGCYDVDKGEKHVKGSVKFDLKTRRKDLFNSNQNSQVPIQYNSEGTFNNKSIGNNNSPGLCQPTSRKLVHLSMFGDGSKIPGSKANVHYSRNDKNENITPKPKNLGLIEGPAHSHHKRYLSHDNGMGDLSRDRFGAPVEPKSTQFRTPGPGSYENDYVQFTKKNDHKLGVVGLSDRNYTFGFDNFQANPGPAYYDPQVIDKKISFHYDRVD
ncbi:unnamed protein product [Moneuplotes crassus]|uniref:Uncharacterized protein n=1 Tax=Euplotes crassus TaxID=5936 RepID=A0AAD1U2I9_EUPCR|nr:unnamed protein product [Moneuplotes crassus]